MPPSSEDAAPRPRASHRLLQRLHRLVQSRSAPKEGDDAQWSDGVYPRLYVRALQQYFGDLETTRGRPLDIVDAGCGSGRFGVPLAAQGHRVLGIDAHPGSVQAARDAAVRAGATMEFAEGDLAQELGRVEAASRDAALCLEVLYTCPDYVDLLSALARTLRPGGLLVASFRTPSYFIQSLLAQGQIEKAATVAETSEGVLRIARLPTYYNWQTPERLRSLMTELGLECVELRPIGVFSGIGVDGSSRLLDLESVEGAAEREAIERLEATTVDGTLGSARYVLAIARRPAADPDPPPS